MNRVDIYNTEYTKLNHAYIQIFDTFQKIEACEDKDPEVQKILAQILMVFNPTLDKIKSEMTVKTRFKDDEPIVDNYVFDDGDEEFIGDESDEEYENDTYGCGEGESIDVEKEEGENGEVIFHPKF